MKLVRRLVRAVLWVVVWGGLALAAVAFVSCAISFWYDRGGGFNYERTGVWHDGTGYAGYWQTCSSSIEVDPGVIGLEFSVADVNFTPQQLMPEHTRMRWMRKHRRIVGNPAPGLTPSLTDFDLDLTHQPSFFRKVKFPVHHLRLRFPHWCLVLALICPWLARTVVRHRQRRNQRPGFEVSQSPAEDSNRGATAREERHV